MTKTPQVRGKVGTAQRNAAPRPMGTEVKESTGARGANARALLASTLPAVLEILTLQQIQQVQRVMDAAVSNPEIEKEAEELARKATKKVGELTVVDPVLMRRSQQKLNKFVTIREQDKRIKLDLKDLLDSDALKPTTDNPDEIAYLERVKKTLETHGVWLRLAPKIVRDPNDRSRHIVDPKQFEVWISLGPEGEAFNTKTGRLSREVILDTQHFGAGYYDAVNRGPIQTELNKLVKTLRNNIESGITLHEQQEQARRETNFVVVGVSDVLGWADYPSLQIWDDPRRIIGRALELNINGNVMASTAFLIAAAYVARDAAELLDQYIYDTTKGASRAVTVLTVLKVAGQVAEGALLLVGVIGMVRGVSMVAAEAGSIDAIAEQFLKEYLTKNPELRRELTQVRWIKGPKGTVSGGVKPGTSGGAGEGFHKGY